MRDDSRDHGRRPGAAGSGYDMRGLWAFAAAWWAMWAVIFAMEVL